MRETNSNEVNDLDSNRCSPDAFVYMRDISCSRREFFEGVNATLQWNSPLAGFVPFLFPFLACGSLHRASQCLLSGCIASWHVYGSLDSSNGQLYWLTVRNLTLFEIHVSNESNRHTYAHLHTFMYMNSDQQIKWETRKCVHWY